MGQNVLRDRAFFIRIRADAAEAMAQNQRLCARKRQVRFDGQRLDFLVRIVENEQFCGKSIPFAIGEALHTRRQNDVFERLAHALQVVALDGGITDKAVVRRAGPRFVEAPVDDHLAVWLLPPRLFEHRLVPCPGEHFAPLDELFERFADAEILLDHRTADPAVLHPRFETVMRDPALPHIVQRKLLFGNEAADIPDIVGSRASEFGERRGGKPLERVDTFVPVAEFENIVPVPHAHERRRIDIRRKFIQLEAQAVEQPQNEELLRHGRAARKKLVAAAPKDVAGMRPNAFDDRSRLLLHNGEVMRVVAVAVACERELLPDHDAVLVAEVKKAVFIDDRPAPYAENIHVRVARDAGERLVGVAVDLPIKISGLTKLLPFAKICLPLISNVIGGSACVKGKAVIHQL